MAELALDDAERMLDLRTHLSDDEVDLSVEWMHSAAFGRLSHDTPNLAGSLKRVLALDAEIALVGRDRGLAPMEQLIPDLTVVQLGGRGLEAVGHAALGIYTDVGFHAEVPVIALFRQ